MRVVHETLNNYQSVPFWQFVINPNSFSQTVENIFYCAHLVREGKIGVDAEENPEGEVCKSSKDECEVQMLMDCIDWLSGEEEAENSNDLGDRIQYMACFDMDTWEVNAVLSSMCVASLLLKLPRYVIYSAFFPFYF
jgi:hypothetical protein